MTSNIIAYDEFIAAKNRPAGKEGVETSVADMPDWLFDFQKFTAAWAATKGRAAIFAGTGLGKTRMQVAWADRVIGRDGRCLVLAPLAVGPQTVREASVVGVETEFDKTGRSDARIVVSNYESFLKFDPEDFVAVVLDESSILKSYMGKTKQALIARFMRVLFKLCCTATPSPNDHLELGNHAEFLGVMRSNEMISRFFLNDTMVAGGYRLKGHAKKLFWTWVSTWAAAFESPEDIGFDGAAFVLPELRVRETVVSTESLPPHPGELFRNPEMNATQLHREARLTAPLKAKRIAEEIEADTSDDQWLIWCNTNYEADEMSALLPDAVEIRGNHSDEKKETALLGFANGDIRRLVTKPGIAGFGMNWQSCHKMAFMGLGFSFERYFQAVRRCWRFGQKSTTDVLIMSADSEGAQISAIKRKTKAHNEMTQEMSKNSEIHRNDATVVEPQAEVRSGPSWTLHLGDCVKIASGMEEGSVDFSVFSPPFSNLYIYSDSKHDMGNTDNDAHFFEQFGYLARQLHRVTKTGRLVAIHCKDLPLYMGRDGAAGLRDFPGDTVRAMEAAGFTYHSRVCIWKDPVIEMQRTKNHGLLYKQLCKDSAASRQGMADYIVVLRKWGDEENTPVNSGQPERFFDYVGGQPPNGWEIERGRTAKERERLYSISVWQRYASPVWFDIRQTNVLNVKAARSAEDEKHICPLQLEVIERAVELWSNPGDLVFSPFAGIGSEGHVAVRAGRRFVGAELKRSYFDCAAKNIAAASVKQDDMFAAAD